MVVDFPCKFFNERFGCCEQSICQKLLPFHNAFCYEISPSMANKTGEDARKDWTEKASCRPGKYHIVGGRMHVRSGNVWNLKGFVPDSCFAAPTNSLASRLNLNYAAFFLVGWIIRKVILASAPPWGAVEELSQRNVKFWSLDWFTMTQRLSQIPR